MIDLDDTDNDTYLESLIPVARDRVEELTGRKLITQSWYAYLQDWPAGDFIELPFGSLQSVTAVKYTDTDGSESTWSNTEYIVDTDYKRGRITLADGYTWPNEVLYPSNPIEVDFTCGYGTGGSDVPGMLIHAIKMLIAELYENREVNLIGANITEMPTFMNLIDKYRLMGL